MASAILFEDTFEVKNKDPDGKKFDKGAYCTGAKMLRPARTQSCALLYFVALPCTLTNRTSFGLALVLCSVPARRHRTGF